jgi:hypothetical protein
LHTNHANLKRELLSIQSLLHLGDESSGGVNFDPQKQLLTITLASQGTATCFLIEIVIDASIQQQDNIAVESLLRYFMSNT